jgi:hypothetical protein
MEDITQKFVVRKILEGIKRSRPKQKDMVECENPLSNK